MRVHGKFAVAQYSISWTGAKLDYARVVVSVLALRSIGPCSTFTVAFFNFSLVIAVID